MALYEEDCSLQSIADALVLNPIKVRKLLITASVYESEVAEKVQDTFEEYREAQSYKDAIRSTANNLQLSKASVTSYLPYKKRRVLSEYCIQRENQCWSRTAEEIQSNEAVES